MPLFLQNGRQKEPRLSISLRDDLAINTLRHSKSEAVLNERPKTSSGVTDRKFNRPSMWTTSAARESPSTSVPSRHTVYDEDMGIGLALGSPSEARPPYAFGSFVHTTTAPMIAHQNETEEIRPASQESCQAAGGQVRPKLKRWPSVSGLFGRKKASNPVSSPLSRISEDSAATPETASKSSQDKPRHSLHLKLSRKSRLPSPPPSRGKSRGNTNQILTPTPGEARAFEAADPYERPRLEINIPESGFDRYSIMFSNLLGNEPRQPRQSLLARRQGVESLTIKSPGFGPVRVELVDNGVILANVCEKAPRDLPEILNKPEPDRPALQRASTHLPPRTFSLAPHPSQSRLSAIPAPLFSERPRPPLKTSQSAIGLQTVASFLPASSEQKETTNAAHDTTAEYQRLATDLPTPRLAFSSDSPLDSPATDAGAFYSRHGSTTSTPSTSHFPPSPTSSTYSYCFPMSATYIRSPTLSDFHVSSKSPPSAASPPTAAPEPQTHPRHLFPAEQYLAVPTPASHSPVLPSTPWDLTHSGPTSPFPSSSPSPRLKFGYDAPHSPLIAVARTVTVCVRAGTGKAQRPQFVGVPPGCRAESAVFVGGAADAAASAGSATATAS